MSLTARKLDDELAVDAGIADPIEAAPGFMCSQSFGTAKTFQSQTARGKSFASFGEIVQGRLSSDEDFLITLPIDLWSTCKLTCEYISGPSYVKTELTKSGQVASEMLSILGMHNGIKLSIDFDSSIPIGKGLSSSTADMLAVIRAFQDLFGIVITKPFISRLFTRIEPHDGIHYDMSVAYNHRQGRLLKNFNYIPNFQIVAVDAGGELSTVEYNRKLTFTPKLLNQYDELYSDLCAAFVNRDDIAIAECAYRSAALHVSRTDNQLLTRLLDKSTEINALGILATHSGTCGGILLPSNASEAVLQRAEKKVSELGRVFRTKTLQILL